MHEGHRYKQHPSKYLLTYFDINMFLFQSIFSNIDNPAFNLVFLLFSIALIFKSNIQKIFQTQYESLTNIFAIPTVSYVWMLLIKSPTK